jgi:hypothetical protein
MSRVQLPEVSAKFIADVEGMLRDLKRAENATGKATAAMDKEVDKFAKNFKRKFSLGEVGKDVLRGLGIGSGFAVAQQAAQFIADQWKEAAQRAQEIEAISGRIAASVVSRMDARKTDEQLLTSLLERQAALVQQIDAAGKGRTATTTYTDREGNVKTVTANFAPTSEDRLRQQQLAEQVEQLEAKIQEVRNKAAEQKVREAETGYALVERLDRENADALRATAQGLADDRRRIAEEELRYTIELHQAEMQATEARDKRLAEFTETRMKAVHAAIFDESEAALDALKVDAESWAGQMNQLWNTVSDRAGQEFADMVLTGRAAFGDLVDIVARSVLEIAARMAIINPLMNMVFGGSAGWQMLPTLFAGRAAGGPVNAGDPYMVGERGPELFVPRTAGRIIPNGTGGGQAPVTYAPTYNIAPGVTRAELLPILRQHGRAVAGAIAEAQRRGAPITSAFA